IGFPMAPSVGIIIYQSRLKIHRPLWCWLGWGVRRGMEESEVIAGAGTRRDRVERTLLSAAFDVGFDLAVAFCGHREDQKQPQGQERRTGVSALHSALPLLFCGHWEDQKQPRRSKATPGSRAADRSVRPTLAPDSPLSHARIVIVVSRT